MKYLFLFLILLSAYCVQSQDAMSVWDTTGIKVDGHIKEWPSFFRFYISGAKLQFDFCNDSNNLYLCIKAVDIESQSRLMHSGIDIWFDPTGKKKHKSGITFPLKLEGNPGDIPQKRRGSIDPSLEPSERSRASKLREHVVFAQTQIKVTGIPAIKEPEIALQNNYGIDIAYDWDSLSILCVEYKIPLSLVYQHPVTHADLQQPVGLSIVAGAAEGQKQSAATPAQSNSGMGGMQRGMGGSNGGGYGGGSRGGSSRSGQQQNNPANDRYSSDNAEQKVFLKVHWETAPVH